MNGNTGTPTQSWLVQCLILFHCDLWATRTKRILELLESTKENNFLSILPPPHPAPKGYTIQRQSSDPSGPGLSYEVHL